MRYVGRAILEERWMSPLELRGLAGSREKVISDRALGKRP